MVRTNTISPSDKRAFDNHNELEGFGDLPLFVPAECPDWMFFARLSY
jgi:hypothetical protein